MAPRKTGNKNNIVARLVTDKKEQCAFCYRKVDDELLYGKLYAIGDIQCHYYCVLLSSCLVQKGKDIQGLFGFLYEDILLEVERCKKHKCSFCNQIGANLGCSISQCRKQFHLPCGRERNAVSLFYGNYKSFCQNHAPKQKIPESIMLKAKIRKSKDNKSKKIKDCYFKDLKELSSNGSADTESDAESVCVICYERVDGYPTPNTFWPPCCARDAWFHRTCLQRMALSAGMHYIKCPLCNDKENFYEAVVSQGYYVPDRDAAWELEQNAFSEIYERPMICSATDCACPMGRSHDADIGAWCIMPCMLCGSSAQHASCGGARHVCAVCSPAAPTDLDELADCIQAVISQEQSVRSSRRRCGPVMPSRMSLRRTKMHTNRQIPSCSSAQTEVTNETESLASRNTTTSRDTLNLKMPRKSIIEKENISSPIRLQFSPNKIENNQKSPYKLYSNKFDSPTKLLEEGLKNKLGGEEILKKDDVIAELRTRFKKPQPLSVKKKIINDILNGLLDDLLLDNKQKEPTKQWKSPIKCCNNENDQDVIEIPQKPPEIIDLTNTTHNTEITENCQTNTPKKLKTIDTLTDSSLEISANNETVNIDVFKSNNSQKETVSDIKTPLKNKKSFKFSPCNNDSIDSKNLDIDIERFKNQYLDEVSCSKMINKENSKKKMYKKRKLDTDKIVLELESKKKKKRISIKNKNISVKIKWRKEQLKLQFNDVKSKKRFKKYKQYVLKYSPEKSTNVGTLNIAQNNKTDIDKTPVKRKLVKHEKSPDNLIQTSIQKFFKVQTPIKESN